MSYMGGKGNCYRRVIGAMPRHATYIETHLGAGAVMRYKQPARRQIGIDLDEAVLARWSAPAGTCELVNADAADFLLAFPFDGSELVYCDPPYPPSTRSASNRYRCEYGDEEHANLLAVLRKLPCAVMISSAPCDLYNDSLRDWRRMDFGAGARRGRRMESLWMNYPQPDLLHDARFRGSDFRERERLKRRLATLTRRIEGMPQAERAVFAGWYAQRFPEDLYDHSRAP